MAKLKNQTNGLDKGEKGEFKDERKSKLFFVPENELSSKTELTGLQKTVFMDRYSLKDKDGASMETTPEQMWMRVAKGVAQFEKEDDRGVWEEKFYDIMRDFKFVPGGRILSGAGTGYEVTFFNCYVIPSPKDSRGGIMENITQTVEIQSRAGGVGVNLSSLRPRGARVRKVNGTSSGPVNWASLYSTANHDVIQQGGSRRGALMLMLNDWHPDVKEFIKVKEDLSKIPGANLSVCVSDEFMDAVKNNREWELVFPDFINEPDYDEVWDGDIEAWKSLGKKVVVYETVKARDIWNLISKAAWKSAEPGLHFIERSNKRSNTWYFERLIATNPCFTGDTLVSTKKGLITIEKLYKNSNKKLPYILTDERVGKKKYHLASKVIQTGTKQVYRLTTDEGYEVRLTNNHKVLTERGWVEAKDLKTGEKLLIQNRKGGFGKTGSLSEGQILGWLVGDGTLKSSEAVLSFFGGEKEELAPYFARMVSSLVDIKSGSRRSYPVGVRQIAERNEARVVSQRLWRYVVKQGIEPGDKLKVPYSVLSGNEKMQRGFLQALFTADGHASGTPEKGLSVRLTSISDNLLKDVQRLLLNFGIASKIYSNRRKEGDRMLPNGKGGSSLYHCHAYGDLVISKSNILTFAREIGFLSEYKNIKIVDWFKQLKKGPYKESFTVRFKELLKEGMEMVYDLTEPVTHSLIANGIVAHNCGEQPLGAWSVCNLGAMNLVAYVNAQGGFNYEKLGEDVQVAMRFMDNVCDANFYFYKETYERQMDIRRTGLGTMGLGDALIKMKVRYGSNESVELIEKIYKVIRDNAYWASSEIAKEKGSFRKYDKEKYLKGYFIKKLPKYVRENIAKNGIRNAVLLTQAPTGTTSLLSGVSSGIEPVYNFEFKRKDRTGEHIVYHPLFEEWKKENPNSDKPDYFVCAMDLTPEDHLKVQAKIQEYTDSSISKTVNAPNDYSVEDVKRLYTLAYEWGCKGITFFRDGSRAGVLESVKDEKKEEAKKEEEKAVSQGDYLVDRPFVVHGATYKIQTPSGKAFITINEDENNDPLEVFVNVGNAGSDIAAFAEALGRLISATFRMRGSVSAKKRALEISEQLSGIGGRRSVGFGANRIMSLPDAIGIAIATHYGFRGASVNLSNGDGTSNGLSNGHTTNGVVKEVMFASDATQKEVIATSQIMSASPMQAELPLMGKQKVDLCPECGSHTLIFEEGCAKCYTCGHSEC